MQTPIRNDVSHIKFEQTVQKLYVQDIYGGHLEFLLLVHQNVARLSSQAVFLNICR